MKIIDAMKSGGGTLKKIMSEEMNAEKVDQVLFDLEEVENLWKVSNVWDSTLMHAWRNSFIFDCLNQFYLIIIMTLFRSRVGQRPTNWEHHLYHAKVDGDLSHHRHTYVNT